MALEYSNSRREAVMDNWPSGKHRVQATFKIETKAGKGERATRTTINPKTNRPNATKTLTYARKARIVDGDDGRTYLAMLTQHGHISIMRGDMTFSEESIFPTDPRYQAIFALFNDEAPAGWRTVES